MSWQNFGNLTGGNQPVSLIDTLSAQIGQAVLVPCTVTGGANNLVLTPRANAPAVTAYNEYTVFAFVPTTGSTAAVQVQVGSLAQLNLYVAGNVQAGNGSLVAGSLYLAAFQSTLAANGGLIIISATPATISSLPVTVPQGGTGSTSFSAFGPVAGGTTSTGALQAISPGTAGQILTSNGGAALPSFQSAAASSGLVSVVTYTTTQTITIPAGATKAWIRLCGGGGGTGSAGVQGAGGAGGLEKYVSGLTAGNTLALTIGAGGAGTGIGGVAGGNTVLASGTQTITTLTGNGGANGALNPSAGGTATNGDVNTTGGDGSTAISVCVVILAVGGGSAGFSNANITQGANNAGTGHGQGAVGTSQAGSTGICVIAWFV